jgi:urease accessory protein
MIPTSFVSMMALGFLFGIRGIEVPMTEQGILASVFVLGLLIATATRLPVLGGSLLVSCFALFHGFAHGLEMPLNTSGMQYALGFMGTTALLHGLGVGIAFGFRRILTEQMLRVAGFAVVSGGIYLSL